MNKIDKRLIFNSLSKKNSAVKRLKKQYKITGKDLEILATCSLLTEQEYWFSAREVQEFMKNSYYSSDIAYSLVKLRKLNLIQIMNEPTICFQPTTYYISSWGKLVLDNYCEMCEVS